MFGLLLVFLLGAAAGLRAQETDWPAFHQADLMESVTAPGTWAKLSLGLLYDQATVQAPSWGSGTDGLERRAGTRIAGLMSRTTMEVTVARLRDTSPHYERCQCKGFGPRSRHAIVSEFAERTRYGGIAAPVARFAGIGASAAVTSMMEPPGSGSISGRAAMMVGTDLGFNMLQEFWPEIRRTLLLRKRQ